jgi:hypothetical protein
MDFKKDYYTTLGLSRNCQKEEIKAAYRRLVKLYHPDRVPDVNPALILEINEAYEILGDPVKRAAYDAFFSQATESEKSDVKQRAQSQSVRTYERKYTVTVIEKIYLRGKIRVKYWAEALEPEESYLHSVSYLLNPTETILFVDESDLHIRKPSAEWEQAISIAEIFRTPVTQPVRCEVTTDRGKVVYELQLTDIRVANVELTDISKYDTQSMGTLIADVYAEVVHPITNEEAEWVTECVGPTGREEYKVEGGWRWKRTEYYHADCSTYWSDWERLSPQSQQQEYSKAQAAATTSFTSTYRRPRRAAYSYTDRISRAGCSDWLQAGLGILALALIPELRLPLLTILVVALAFSFGGVLFSFIARRIPGLLLLAIAGLLFAGIRSAIHGERTTGFVRQKSAHDTVVTKTQIRLAEAGTGRKRPVYDTLITHHVRWVDYDTNHYALALSVRIRDVRAAALFHQELSQYSIRSIDEVYLQLDGHDEDALDLIYEQFDSLRRARGLTEKQLAQALVSCIQSLPYYLVVPRTCEASQYTDAFTRQYLRACKTDCCVGNVSFGVRSPVEFFSDLKGDCDTRSLLLYKLLRRFNYTVAIITSEYYRHAAIAIALSDVLPRNAAAFTVNGQTLYAWETTAAGYRPGMLPDAVSDLHHWKISLINQ